MMVDGPDLFRVKPLNVYRTLSGRWFWACRWCMRAESGYREHSQALARALEHCKSR